MSHAKQYQIPVTLAVNLVKNYMDDVETVLPTRVLSVAGSIKVGQWLEHYARLPQYIVVWINKIEANPAQLNPTLTLPPQDTYLGHEETLILTPEDFTWYVTD